MAKKTNKSETRTSNIPVKGKKNEQKKEKGVLTYKEGMTVADVAEGMGKTNAQIVMKLMQLGIMANQNQTIDRETIELVAIDFGFELKDEVVTDVTRFDEFTIEDKEEDLVSRPPVVTIMGHVDHGKPTLLATNCPTLLPSNTIVAPLLVSLAAPYLTSAETIASANWSTFNTPVPADPVATTSATPSPAIAYIVPAPLNDFVFIIPPSANFIALTTPIKVPAAVVPIANALNTAVCPIAGIAANILNMTAASPKTAAVIPVIFVTKL